MDMLTKIFTYGIFSDGKDIGDWDITTIAEKMYKTGERFTAAEKHAPAFFEKMGDFMGPKEVWKKPYGQMLNETRKLH